MMLIEQKIQEIFNKYFIDCTVITIPHRIKTIIYYNKILLLYNGQIKNLINEIFYYKRKIFIL